MDLADRTGGAGCSVLVVAPSWVGDIVMSQIVYRQIKASDPGVSIDVLAPEAALPLVERMPEVRRGMRSPLKHGRFNPGEVLRCAGALRKTRYQRAIVLPRSMKSALAPWLAGIPVRSGFRGEFRYGLINDMRPGRPERNARLVDAYARLVDRDCRSTELAPSLVFDRELGRAIAAKLGASTQKRIAALFPGAEFGPSKMWPAEYYRELAVRLVAAGLEVWIVGSGKDRPSGDRIAAGDAAIHNLCGKTTLADVVDLLSLATVAVSNDSGLMHIAAAVGCPVVALYGSTTPAYTPPLGEAASVIYRSLSCSPCFERNCRFGHTACLRDIPVDEVLGLTRHWLARDPAMGTRHGR
jgi:heptosyltransferase II